MVLGLDKRNILCYYILGIYKEAFGNDPLNEGKRNRLGTFGIEGVMLLFSLGVVIVEGFFRKAQS